MTSTAGSFDEHVSSEQEDRGASSLSQTLIEQLDEQTLTALLVARFRAFVGDGYSVNEALLAAVGSTRV